MSGLFLIILLYVVFSTLIIIKWNKHTRPNEIIKIDIPPQRPGEIIFPDGRVEILQNVFSEEMKEML